MVKHTLLHHPENPPTYRFNLHRVWKTSLQRQIGEAIQIAEEKQSILMNSKSEWGSNPIPRVQIMDQRQSESTTDSQATTPVPGSSPTISVPPDASQDPPRAKRKRTDIATPIQQSRSGPMTRFLMSNSSNLVMAGVERKANTKQSQAELENAEVNSASQASNYPEFEADLTQGPIIPSIGGQPEDKSSRQTN